MSFVQFASARGPALTSVVISVTVTKMGRPKLRVALPGPLAAELGWASGDRIEVLFGTEEHFGQARLARAATGYRLSNAGASIALSLVTRGLPRGVRAEAHPSEAVSHRSARGELTLDLPPWFYTEAARIEARKAKPIAGSLADVPLKRAAGGHAVAR